MACERLVCQEVGVLDFPGASLDTDKNRRLRHLRGGMQWHDDRFLATAGRP